MLMTHECNAQLTEINQAWWHMQPGNAISGGCSLPFEKQPHTHRSLYNVHLFNCLVTQIANQPITWQQLNAFRHLDVVKTTCWSSNRSSERGRKGFKWLNVEWLLVSDGLVWVFHKLLIYWDFHTQPSLGFTENGPKKRKYPVSGSHVDENALLMSEVRGEWTDWLEMIERQQ